MSLRGFLITAIVAAAVASALAADYVVGDNVGWNQGVSYTSWAEGKDFHVGDSIMFLYTPGVHNVIEVNETEFQECTYSNATAKIFTSGNTLIPLDSLGKKRYISGIDDDCYNGMKLVVTISKAEGPTPAPISESFNPPPATSAAGCEVVALKSCAWMVAVMAACRMITV